MIEDITSDTLPAFLEGDKPVVIDFWAPWCGPCKAMKPEYEAFANAHGQHVKVGKVNVDDYPEIAQVFNLYSIPTVVVFEKGEPVKTLVGARNNEQLTKDLASWLK